MSKTKFILFMYFILLAINAGFAQIASPQDSVVSNSNKIMSKNIPIPPSKMGKKLLIDDNFDYLMVIDEATISPTTIKLGNNIKKEVIQAWVYVFYKTLYAPDVVDGELTPFETNKHLVYFSLVDKTSASTVFYLYDKNGSLTNKMINDVKESDFKPVKQGTIGQIQFDIIKSSQKN